MNIRKTLQHPVTLVVQGFAVGAFLFFALHPIAAAEQAPATPTAASVLATLQA